MLHLCGHRGEALGMTIAMQTDARVWDWGTAAAATFQHPCQCSRLGGLVKRLNFSTPPLCPFLLLTWLTYLLSAHQWPALPCQLSASCQENTILSDCPAVPMVSSRTSPYPLDFLLLLPGTAAVPSHCLPWSHIPYTHAMYVRHCSLGVAVALLQKRGS